MYICCGKYSLLLVFVFAPRGFSPVLGYSILLKSQHFEIQIRPGNRQTKNHLLNELPLNIYLFIYLHGSDNLEKVMNFTSRLEKSLNSVQVLEQYLTSLLGLEKSLKFTTLSTPGFFFCKIRLFYRRKFWRIPGVRTCETHGQRKSIFVHEQYFISVLYFEFYLYLKCNCKSYPVILLGLVADSSIKY